MKKMHCIVEYFIMIKFETGVENKRVKVLTQALMLTN